MPDLVTIAVVCRRRHPLEWLAPTPRKQPCDECCLLVGLVLDAAFARIAL